jgi:hypothetical protein
MWDQAIVECRKLGRMGSCELLYRSTRSIGACVSVTPQNHVLTMWGEAMPRSKRLTAGVLAVTEEFELVNCRWEKRQERMVQPIGNHLPVDVVHEGPVQPRPTKGRICLKPEDSDDAVVLVCNQKGLLHGHFEGLQRLGNFFRISAAVANVMRRLAIERDDEACDICKRPLRGIKW